MIWNLYLFSSSETDSSSSVQHSSDVMYTYFSFDVNIQKTVFQAPINICSLLEVVPLSKLKPHLSISIHGEKEVSVYLCHKKCLAFRIFRNQEQEACSSGERYSTDLRLSLKDRAPQGYVTLPNPTSLRAAEVYDGGEMYGDVGVEVNEELI